MAMIANDVDHMVQYFNRIRDDQQFRLDKDKDPIVEELFSPSPINLDSFMRYQLEKDLGAGQSNFSSAQSSQSKEQTQKTVVKVFDPTPSSNASSFTFTKTDLAKPKQYSDLRKIIAADTQQKQKEKQNVVSFKVTVFLPSREKIQVEVGEKTSVEDLVKTALQQYEIECNDAKKNIRFNLNPTAYKLLFAEDDGEPDEDMPELNKHQEISQFKSASFALCPDTSFKVVKSSMHSQKRSLKLFKVIIPKHLGGGFVPVAYQPHLTLENVMESVCTKQKLDPAFFKLDYGNKQGKVADLKGKVTLGDVGVSELLLLEKDPNLRNHSKKANSKGSINKKSTISRIMRTKK